MSQQGVRGVYRFSGSDSPIAISFTDNGYYRIAVRANSIQEIEAMITQLKQFMAETFPKVEKK